MNSLENKRSSSNMKNAGGYAAMIRKDTPNRSTSVTGSENKRPGSVGRSTPGSGYASTSRRPSLGNSTSAQAPSAPPSSSVRQPSAPSKFAPSPSKAAPPPQAPLGVTREESFSRRASPSSTQRDRPQWNEKFTYQKLRAPSALNPPTRARALESALMSAEGSQAPTRAASRRDSLSGGGRTGGPGSGSAAAPMTAPLDSLLTDLKAAIEKLSSMRKGGDADAEARIKAISEVVRRIPTSKGGSAAASRARSPAAPPRQPSPAIKVAERERSNTIPRPPSAPRMSTSPVVPPLDMARLHSFTAQELLARPPSASKITPGGGYASQLRSSSVPRSVGVSYRSLASSRDPSPSRGSSRAASPRVPKATVLKAAAAASSYAANLRSHPVALSNPTTARETVRDRAASVPVESRAASPEPDRRPVVREIVSSSGQGLERILRPVGAEASSALPALDFEAPRDEMARWTTKDRRAASARKKPLVSGLLVDVRKSSLGSRGLYIHVAFQDIACSPRSVRVIGSDTIEAPPTDITPEVALNWSGNPLKALPDGHAVLYVQGPHVKRYMGLACSGHVSKEKVNGTPRHVATHVSLTAEAALKPYPHLTERFVNAAKDTLFPPSAAPVKVPAPQPPPLVVENKAGAVPAAGKAPGGPPPPPPLPKGLLLKKREVSESTSAVSEASTVTGSTAVGGPPPPPPLPSSLLLKKAAASAKPSPAASDDSSAAPSSSSISSAVSGTNSRPSGPPPPPALPIKRSLQQASGRSAASPALRPSKPTVKLFWDKIPSPQSKGTVWGNLEQLRVELQLDFKSLEEEFEQRAHSSASLLASSASLRASRSGSVGPEDSSGSQGSKARLAVLPVQKGNHVAMWLARNKLSPQGASQILTDLCYGRALSGPCPLKLEALEGFLSVLPSLEDSRALRKHFREMAASATSGEEGAAARDPYEHANPIEKMLFDVLCVPDYDERLRAVQFKLQLNERLDALQEQLEKITAACADVERSEALRVVLRVVLLVGNFLNSGNRNGGAKGFSIDTLPKLKHVRSTKAKERTLLTYVAGQLLDLPKTGAKGGPSSIPPASASVPESAPSSPSSIFSLRAALPCLDAASKISFRELGDEIEDLRRNLELIEVALAALPYVGEDEAEPDKDPFHRVLEEFHSQAVARVKSAEGGLGSVKGKFAKLMSFVSGQGYKECQDFFVMLRDFAVDLDVAIQMENARRAAASLAAKRKEIQAQKKGTAGPALQSGSSSGRNVGLSVSKTEGNFPEGAGATQSSAVGGVAVRGPSAGSPGSTQGAGGAAASANVDLSLQGTLLLNAVRAYSKLSPERRRTLLTEQGAKARLRQLAIDRRHSITGGGADDLSWLLRSLGVRTPVRVKHASPVKVGSGGKKAVTSPKKVKRKGVTVVDVVVDPDNWPRPTKLHLEGAAAASSHSPAASLNPALSAQSHKSSAKRKSHSREHQGSSAKKAKLPAGSPSALDDLEVFRQEFKDFVAQHPPSQAAVEAAGPSNANGTSHVALVPALVAPEDLDASLPAMRLENRFLNLTASSDDEMTPPAKTANQMLNPAPVRASLYASLDGGASAVPLSVSAGGSYLPLGATRSPLLQTRPGGEPDQPVKTIVEEQEEEEQLEDYYGGSGSSYGSAFLVHPTASEDMDPLRESCGENWPGSKVDESLSASQRFPTLSGHWTQGLQSKGARALVGASTTALPASLQQDLVASPEQATKAKGQSLSPQISTRNSGSGGTIPVNDARASTSGGRVPSAPKAAAPEAARPALLQLQPSLASLEEEDSSFLLSSRNMNNVNATLFVGSAPFSAIKPELEAEGVLGEGQHETFVLESPGPGLEGNVRGRLANPDRRGEAQELEFSILDHSALLAGTPLAALPPSPLLALKSTEEAPVVETTFMVPEEVPADLSEEEEEDAMGQEDRPLEVTAQEEEEGKKEQAAPETPAAAPVAARSPMQINENAAFAPKVSLAVSPIPMLLASPEKPREASVTPPKSALRLTDNRMFRTSYDEDDVVALDTEIVDREERRSISGDQRGGLSAAHLSIAQLYVSSTRTSKVFVVPSPIAVDKSTEDLHRIALASSFVASPGGSSDHQLEEEAVPAPLMDVPVTHTPLQGDVPLAANHHRASIEVLPAATGVDAVPSPFPFPALPPLTDLDMMRCSAASASIGTFIVHRGIDQTPLPVPPTPTSDLPPAAKDLIFTPEISGISGAVVTTTASPEPSASESCAESAVLLDRVQRAIEDSKRMLAASNALRASQKSWAERNPLTESTNSIKVYQDPAAALKAPVATAPASEEVAATAVKGTAPAPVVVTINRMEVSPLSPVPDNITARLASPQPKEDKERALRKSRIRLSLTNPPTAPAPAATPTRDLLTSSLPLPPPLEQENHSPALAALLATAAGIVKEAKLNADALRASSPPEFARFAVRSPKRGAYQQGTPHFSPSVSPQVFPSPSPQRLPAAAAAVAGERPRSESVINEFMKMMQLQQSPSPAPKTAEAVASSPVPPIQEEAEGALDCCSEQGFTFAEASRMSESCQGQGGKEDDELTLLPVFNRVTGPAESSPARTQPRDILPLEDEEDEHCPIQPRTHAEPQEDREEGTWFHAAAVPAPERMSLMQLASLDEDDHDKAVNVQHVFAQEEEEDCEEEEAQQQQAGESGQGAPSQEPFLGPAFFEAAVPLPTSDQAVEGEPMARARSWSFDQPATLQGEEGALEGGRAEQTPEPLMQPTGVPYAERRTVTPNHSTLASYGSPLGGPSPSTPQSASLAVSSPSFVVGGRETATPNKSVGAPSLSPGMHMTYDPTPAHEASPSPEFAFALAPHHQEEYAQLMGPHTQSANAPALGLPIRSSIDSAALLDDVLELNARMRALSPPWMAQESAQRSAGMTPGRQSVLDGEEVTSSSVSIPSAPWQQGGRLSRELSVSKVSQEGIRKSKNWAANALRELKAMSFKRKNSGAKQQAPEDEKAEGAAPSVPVPVEEAAVHDPVVVQPQPEVRVSKRSFSGLFKPRNSMSGKAGASIDLDNQQQQRESADGASSSGAAPPNAGPGLLGKLKKIF